MTILNRTHQNKDDPEQNNSGKVKFGKGKSGKGQFCKGEA